MGEKVPASDEQEHVVECARRILRAVEVATPKNEPRTFDMSLANDSLGETCAHDVMAGVLLVRVMAAAVYPNLQSFLDDSAVLLARIKLAEFV